MIDLNRTYRTRDGRPVRIYATDGGHDGETIHGAIWCGIDGWVSWQWKSRNMQSARGGFGMDLIEVTLADDLRDQIPWEALRPEIRWVAMDRTGDWWGFSNKPVSETWAWDTQTSNAEAFNLEAFRMPRPDTITTWKETLIARPEDK